MRRHLSGPCRALACCFLLFPALAMAEGFGTPTMDGQLSPGDTLIYGPAEAMDPDDSPFGGDQFALQMPMTPGSAVGALT